MSTRNSRIENKYLKLKNSLDGVYSTMGVKELSGKEITFLLQKEKKRWGENEQSVRDLWDNIQEEKETGQKNMCRNN